MMRYIALTIALCLCAMPALACRAPDTKYTIFFDKPQTIADTDTTMRVILESADPGAASARITEVLRAPDGAPKQGELIALQFADSYCGPFLIPGETGMIYGRYDAQNKVLRTYSRRFRDNVLKAP